MSNFSFDELLVFLLEEEPRQGKALDIVISAVLNYSKLVPCDEETVKLTLNEHQFQNTRETWKEIAKGLMTAIYQELLDTDGRSENEKRS